MADSAMERLFLKSACSVPAWHEWWRDYIFAKKGHTNQCQTQGCSLGKRPLLFHFLHCQILQSVAAIVHTNTFHFSPHLTFVQHFSDVTSGLFESLSFTGCCDSSLPLIFLICFISSCLGPPFLPLFYPCSCAMAPGPAGPAAVWYWCFWSYIFTFSKNTYLFMWLGLVLVVACRMFVEACELLATACGIYFPYLGSNLGPLP